MGGSTGSSGAEITVEDCVVESSKEISYVEYATDDGVLMKDESVDSETLDLSTVEGIEEVDSVTVKAGTTVESFTVACGATEGGTPDDGSGDDTDEGDHEDDTGTDGPGSSAATIVLDGCVLESSKDISYVEYLAGGESLGKDETIDTETFDLTTVEGIEDVDSVTVKSGTTVESFAVSCGTASEPAPSPVPDDEETPDEETPEDGDGTSGPGSSAATIVLDGCVLESTKDISYVEYLAGGESLGKDEMIDAETFDLTTVEGIEDVDSVTVKSGTTVQTFAVSCGTAPAPEPAPTPEPAPEPEPEEPEEESPEDGDGTSGPGSSAATITLDGCVLESTKDISYVEFFGGGASLGKDESVGTETFDLTTVEGIEHVDSVTVKSGTTVKTFAVSCGRA